MSIFESVLGAVIGMIDALRLYAPVMVGSLPADNGIAIAKTGGAPTYMMGGDTSYNMTVVINAKHAEQQKAAEALGAIHETLPLARPYTPTSDGCQITSIESTSLPSYLDREENGQWLYGSSMNIRFYKKGQ